ncbi:hypothetical protein [Azospirillum sp. SYSU D00513]|uniref:hypothetical protein n=1 Tax=Azospirillum sp. SYSU D00513 TaxID=2812561 RepID=UPI001A97CD4F|nr:hypothetical protein [Azospirillum sp. SYSU D00513]
MSKSMPPIPPEQQSDKGPGGPGTIHGEGGGSKSMANDNPDKKGQQGSVKANTTHQGYQQDR